MTCNSFKTKEYSTLRCNLIPLKIFEMLKHSFLLSHVYVIHHIVPKRICLEQHLTSCSCAHTVVAMRRARTELELILLVIETVDDVSDIKMICKNHVIKKRK